MTSSTADHQSGPLAQASRISRAVRQRAKALAARPRFNVCERPDVELIGTAYGAWAIPTSLLGADSVCYLAGLGEDASFDLKLIERFGCTAYSFDPVPEANVYAASVTAREPRFDFRPVGLWSADTTLRFYDHTQPGYVSRSATNMHQTGTFTEAHVRSLDSLMGELGHDHIDLLKLSVEGSEYEILGDVLAKSIPVGILCVEFAQPAPTPPIVETVKRLETAGFELLSLRLEPSTWKMTLCSRPSVGV